MAERLLFPILVGILIFALFLSACKPKQPIVMLKTREELENMATEFVSLLANEEYDQARQEFNPTMSKVVSVSDLEHIWRNLSILGGQWQQVRGTRFAEENGYRVIYVNLLFDKGLSEIKVVFDVSGKIAGLWLGDFESVEYKVPDYVDENSFVEEQVIVGETKWILPGTLTKPKNIAKGSKVPAVILVHGSGLQDRDQSLGPNKPFKDLAWGLSTKGVAVLRCEKRTKEYQTLLAGSSEGANLTIKEETIDDTIEAIKLLKNF